MKTFVLLVVAAGIWGFVGYSRLPHITPARAAMPNIPRSHSESPNSGTEYIQLGSSERRKFDLNIEACSNGVARAIAAFYDVDPRITTEPELLDVAARHWTQGGEIAVQGLPTYIVKDQHWVGWLERDPIGAIDGTAAYRVVPDAGLAAAR